MISKPGVSLSNRKSHFFAIFSKISINFASLRIAVNFTILVIMIGGSFRTAYFNHLLDRFVFFRFINQKSFFMTSRLNKSF